ncbi:MAG: metallophosphoesterase [Armatimonadetes bacterium]|nr:metallophosphoesterase [Armatimonadota bacterium]
MNPFLLGACAAAGAAAAYAVGWERWWLEVTRRDVPLPCLSEPLRGLTIAHLSDLHCGPLAPVRFIRLAVDRTNALGADIVAVTGDLVEERPSQVAPVVRELSRLRAPLGVWAVLGNHDLTAGERLCRELLADAGIGLLRNEARLLADGPAPLWIAGVRDNSRYALDDLESALASVPPAARVILLAHSPDIAPEAAERGVDLVLSGHTHGGQVCLPFYGPVLTKSRYGRRFARGLTRVGRTWVYTHRGLGTVRLPARFLARPEIALHRLVHADEA